MIDWMTVQDVADYLRISAATVRKIIKRGDLKAHIFHKTYRIHPEELDNYIAASLGEDRCRSRN